NSPVLSQLANGEIKLIRATFPLAALRNTPSHLDIARLDADSTNEHWESTSVWEASADASIPGRSFFALLKSNQLNENERVQVSAPMGTAETGVRIPAAAIVLSDGQYWCYVEKQPGHFVRIKIDPDKTIAADYFVADHN